MQHWQCMKVRSKQLFHVHVSMSPAQAHMDAACSLPRVAPVRLGMPH